MSLHISPQTRTRAESVNVIANQLYQRINLRYGGVGPFNEDQTAFLSQVINNQQQICALILNIINENQASARPAFAGRHGR